MNDSANVQHRPRVLLLDDEEDLRETVAVILEAEDFDVVVCGTALEALEKLDSGGVDVAVVDLRLPDLDEMTLLERLSDFSDVIPLIIHTGYSSYESAKEAINWGAFAYVEKAGDPEELVRHVRRAIHRHLVQRAHDLEEAVAQRTQELKTSNDSLRRIQADLARAQHIAKLGSFSWEVSSGVVTWSDETYRIFGVDPDETVPSFEVAKSLIYPEDFELWSNALSQAVESGDWFDCEHRALRPDGVVVWIRNEAEIFRDENGNAVGLFGTAQDITERKVAEEKLQSSAKRFRALFEQAGDYCMILDPNTEDGIPIIIDASQSAYTMHGYTREEFVGRPVADIDDAEGRSLVKQRTRQIMTGKPFYIENTHVRKDGSVFPVGVHANRIDVEGEPPLIFTTEYDMSERKVLEQKLRHTQKMEAIGQLAAGVAHEFNNLLCGILCNVDVLLNEKPGTLPPEIQLALEDVRSCGRRGANLTKQLLAFSRQKAPDVSPLDINTVIRGLDRIIQQMVTDRITLDFQLDPELPPGKADRGKVEQAIINLARNAGDAMPDGGTLSVHTSCEHLDESRVSSFEQANSGRFVKMSIADTGNGMTSEIQKRIFEPFFTTKPIGQGTGLGLSTVFADVTHMGGGVEVESNVNEGTVFHIYLPTARSASNDSRRPSERVDHPMTLISDDD
ncbi:PAS domain S-box protein [Rhodopirellula sp. SWK7]|uniref:hybrid sensor histidine kinase/response regulator n=1 Tax=Rhodopirellula sp. SWK7 TaxID=595460 RepID=UPI0002BEB55B|nr:PAS domain S-box protein [Rhodopirellula sp. SWK7]EMI43459.1 multi-sensor hybrid histidine kinase [Rhodopirellula sp. SWK7]